MIDLTAEERRKFAAYLQQEAVTYDGLATEAAKIHEMMAKTLRIKVAALTHVARWLDNVEEVKLG